MPDWLWGRTGYAFFDNSSIIHFCFWVFFGSGPYYIGWPFWKGMLVCMPLALAWEVAEHFLAPAFPQYWKHPESWWNAWLSDPLMCVLGVGLAYLVLKYWTVP